MKKEAAAIIFLAVLLAATLINVRVLEKFSEGLVALVEEAAQYAGDGDWERAVETAERAEAVWQGADAYTHIVVRHAEIDSTTDAFYDFLKALYSREDGNARGAGMLLKAHIDSIAGMEKVTLGSIF